MIDDNLYNSVLRMILKRIKYHEINNLGMQYSSSVPTIASEINTDSGGNNSNPGSINPDNPYDIVGLDNFDYHLLYNSDEDLIGFTSNNGTWKWTLLKDTYDDLIAVNVENPYYSFKIALIFENYDLRKDLLYVVDKGKLTDVILLDTNNQVLAKSLVIDPKETSITVGDSATFTATLELQNGDSVDVSDICIWGIKDKPNNSKILVENGIVTKAEPGQYIVMISCQGLTDTAILTVNQIVLSIYPVNVVINVGDTADFVLKLIKPGGETQDILENVDWRVTSTDSFASIPNISEYGHISNTKDPATFIIWATYGGVTVNEEFVVRAPALVIDPSIVSIYEGDVKKFNAHYVTKDGNIGVTSDCTWVINSTEVSIDNDLNKGYVYNTLHNPGIYTVMATYNGIQATAQLTIIPKEYYIEPQEASINTGDHYQFRAFRRTTMGIVTDISSEVVWQVESPCTVENGIVSNTTQPGKFGLNAVTSVGTTVSAVLNVVEVLLRIDAVDSLTVPVGGTIKLVAVKSDSGGELNVSSSSIWSLNTINGTISKGVVSYLTVSGDYEVTARFGTLMATTIIHVVDFELTVDPKDITVAEGSTVTLHALKDGKDISNDPECLWSVSNSGLQIINGVVKDIFTDLIPPTITIIVTYKNKIATALIHLKKVNFQVIPESAVLSLNQTQQLRAFLLGDDGYSQDVSSNCDWLVNGPVQVTELGEVYNTISAGEYNVNVTYRPNRQLKSSSKIQVANASYIVHNNILKIQIAFIGQALDKSISLALKINDDSWIITPTDLINSTTSTIWNEYVLHLVSGINVVEVGFICTTLESDSKLLSGVVGIRGIDNDHNVIIPESWGNKYVYKDIENLIEYRSNYTMWAILLN